MAVADAAIAFRLPDADPTGIFSDGTHSAVAYTDQTGRAKITGIQWNATPGAVAIRVTATKGTAHAGILIQQTLAPIRIDTPAPLPSHTMHEALPSAVAPLPLPAAPPVGTQPATKAAAPEQLATVPSVDAPPPPRISEPAVSVTNSPTGASKHSGKTKWIILAAVAAAAGGAGVAMMGKKSSGGSAATPPGISIGAPGISIGHP
jgi:hypothetical protein